MVKSRTAPRRPASSKPVSIPTIEMVASSAEQLKLSLASMFILQGDTERSLKASIGYVERSSKYNIGYVERSLKESIEEIRFDLLRREDIFVGLTFWQRVMFLLRGRL